MDNVIFSNKNNIPISRDTVCKEVQRVIGSKMMTAHGWRATASTALHNKGFNEQWIELQLGHSKDTRDPIAAAYNHALYREQRAEMMQWYSDWLDEQKN